MEVALQPSLGLLLQQGLGLPDLSLENEVTLRVLVEREGQFIAVDDLAATSVPGAARRGRGQPARGRGQLLRDRAECSGTGQPAAGGGAGAALTFPNSMSARMIA